MISWVAAFVVGVGFAFLQYGWRSIGQLPAVPARTAAVARAVAVTLVVALLLDAPIGTARPIAPWVALDVSASMVRGDSSAWRAARDSAAVARPESTFAFGDSARPFLSTTTPADPRTTLRPIIDRAIGRGHPLVVVTDGEIDDPDAVAALPPGSRTIVVARHPGVDAAIIALDAPRAVVSGDTAVISVTVVNGPIESPSGSVAVLLDGRVLASAPLDRLAAGAERVVEMLVPVGGGPGPAPLHAVLRVSGDVEPRNDTLAVAIDRARAPSAVFVSSAPDFDSRFAMGVLRGALAIPTRAFLRLAPGVWRTEGSLAAVSEADVRAALRDAPVAIMHGDTAVFGPPRAATAGPLGLVVPATRTDVEWYAAGAPLSPLSPGLTGIAWDSLPPVALSPEPAIPPNASVWRALEVRRGREGDRRAIVSGSDDGRRVVTVSGSGFWRWQFRGGSRGVSSDAFAALWGSIFDWLVAARADRRAAIPDAASVREGASVRWRRGTSADSLVPVVVRQWNGGGGVDSMTLRFGSSATVETAPMAAGLYEVMVRGGSSLLVVNRSMEWVPRAPSVRSAVTAGRAVGSVAGLRGYGWAYVMIVIALCGEWLLRRELGLR